MLPPTKKQTILSSQSDGQRFFIHFIGLYAAVSTFVLNSILSILSICYTFVNII